MDFLSDGGDLRRRGKVFQTSLKGGVKSSPLPNNFFLGGGGENLWKSYFDHSNLFLS